MAWTTPRTWTDGELVTAAIMNAHVRDNLNASGPHLLVRKSADQSVTSSTALVNDTHLTFAVGASEAWQFRLFLRVDASATGDFKKSFSIPASGRIEASEWGKDETNTQKITTYTLTATDGTQTTYVGTGTGTTNPVLIEGFYLGGGTAGSVTLRWAQNTSDGTASKILIHSTLWGSLLA